MRLATILSLALVALLFAGCGGDDKKADKDKKGDAHGHDHEHAHEGPHGGHILELTDDHSVHGEWTHDDASGKVTVMILDAKMKEMPIKAESLKITTTVEGKDPVVSELKAERADGETEGYKFSIVDKPLIDSLKMAGKGVKASLAVDVKGKSLSVDFEAHEDH